MARKSRGFADNNFKSFHTGSCFRGGCNGSRIAGDGIISDDYSEDSGNRKYEIKRTRVRMPMDKIAPESLNGPVIVVQEGKKGHKKADGDKEE